MIFIFLCLIYSLTGAEISTVLIAPDQNRTKKWIELFVFLFVMAALKLATLQYPAMNMCCQFFMLWGWALMLWKQTGWSIRSAVKTYFLIMVIEGAGELTAILIMMLKNGRIVMPGQFEAEGILATLISNVTQLFVVHGWKRKFADKIRKSAKEKPEKLEMWLIMGIHLVFMWLLLPLSFAAETGGNRMLPILLALQVTSITLLVWVLVRDVKNQEIREMQLQIKNQERRDQAFYQHYKEEEEAYRNLHKLRHDFHNQMGAAMSLMERGDTERAEGILSQMEEMLEEGEWSDGEEK